MRLTLTRKIILHMLVVAFLLGGFLGAVEYISLKRSLNKKVSNDLLALRGRLGQMLVEPVVENSDSDIEDVLRMEMCDRNVEGFAVVNTKNKQMLMALGRDENGAPVLLQVLPEKYDHIEMVELENGTQTVAWVKIFLTDRYIIQELRRYVFFTVLKVAVVEIIFILMLFFIVKKITDRLRAGIDMIDGLAQGKINRIEHYTEEDEIGDLVNSVNTVIDLFEEEQREKMEMQEQIFHSSKLASIGKLAAGVAHEVNNPLMVIQGYSEFLEDCIKRCNHPECGEHLHKIQQAVKRIKKIVNGLRIYAKHDAEDMDITVLDLDACIRRCCELVNTIYHSQNIDIKVDLQDEHALVRGSEGQVQQLLMNLLSNARDAVENVSDKRITIKSEIHNSEVIVSVADNGCGIPDAILPKIYDPFFTTKEVGKGTGLGLGICYNIVNRMKGRIEVDAEEGAGTVFRIILPLCVEEVIKAALPPIHLAVERSDTLDEPPPARAGKVLFVDDEPLIREMFALILDDTDIQVDVAASGLEALKKLENEPFDLVVADYCMPEMTGGELFQMLDAREDINVGKIILTGGVTDEMEGQLDSVLDGYLTKPLTRDEIVTAINDYLCKHKESKDDE